MVISEVHQTYAGTEIMIEGGRYIKGKYKTMSSQSQHVTVCHKMRKSVLSLHSTWTAVADLLLVFHQINNINSPDNSPGPSSAKQVHDDDKEESQPRKKCVISLSVMDTMLILIYCQT